MPQTREGAAKSAAKNAGLELGEYLARRAAGLKRCTGCKEWRPVSMFDKDLSRSDGLTAGAHCCRRVKVRVDRRGKTSHFKGRKHTAESRALLREKALGRAGPMAGRRHSIESRQKMSQTRRERGPKGAACHTYVDGKGVERLGERLTDKYKQWRYDVMMRDRFTCQHCGDARGGNLHAHHIKPFSTHPELRTVIANGITLCEPCHKAVHAADRERKPAEA